MLLKKNKINAHSTLSPLLVLITYMFICLSYKTYVQQKVVWVDSLFQDYQKNMFYPYLMNNYMIIIFNQLQTKQNREIGNLSLIFVTCSEMYADWTAQEKGHNTEVYPNIAIGNDYILTHYTHFLKNIAKEWY